MGGQQDDLSEARRVAADAGLTRLTEAHLAQLAASIKTNRSLAERLPKDFGIADEPAHVYRLPLPKGGQ